ncbi:MAG: hypothetical protein KDE35_10650 [Geminicoccaceae bacterium]|nr:hypothetical protein [Geminicoccaceae bacterium]
MSNDPARRFASALLALALLLEWSGTAAAKEYNRREDISPEVQSKLQRTLAKSRGRSVESGEDGGRGAGVRGDIVNTGCGKLEVGSIDEVKPGQRIDRDIIITGDIINAPRNCPRR